MSIVGKIRFYIDNLTLEEKQLAKDYLSSLEEVQEVQSEELTDTLWSKESSETINILIEENELAPQSIEQLIAIKKLINKYGSDIATDRITIRNNLVCIDGYTLPTGVTKQSYKDMKNDPKVLTYPLYAKALLTFIADIISTKFYFSAQRGRLQDGIIDGEGFLRNINTSTNRAIIETLQIILWFNAVIPIGLDKDGYVMYVDIRLVVYCSDHSNSDLDFNDCLVPSD